MSGHSTKRRILFVLPLVFLSISLLWGRLLIPPEGGFVAMVGIREFIVFIALSLLSVFIGGSGGWQKRYSILQRILYVGLLGGGALLALKIMGSMAPRRYTYMGPLLHAVWVFLFIAALLFSVGIMLNLKNLIFVQQTRYTNRNFQALAAAVVLRMLAEMIVTDLSGASMDGWGRDGPMSAAGGIFLGLVILTALINGFRIKWIHYLNKKQKIGVFFLLTLYAGVFPFLVSSADTVSNFSPVAGTFMDSFLLAATVYCTMAAAGILFLLPSAGLMDRRVKELTSFQELSAAMGSILDGRNLAEKAVRLASEIVSADYTWIECEDGDGYTVMASYGLAKKDISDIPGDVLESLRSELAESAGTILINDLFKDRRTRKIRSWRLKCGSLLVSRMKTKSNHLGTFYALNTDRYGFVEESRGLFKAFADQVGVALDNARLVKITIEQQIYKEELRVAHDAQMRLLPRRLPQTGVADIEGMCMTANEIGGDLYDIIEAGEDRIDIVIGDVSGKGASAAFYMAELKGMIQALAHHLTSPRDILREVNTFVRDNFEPGMFATMIYGVFIPSHRELRLARAGHPPAYLVREGAASAVETEGMGLGLADEDVFSPALQEHTIVLQPGDTVFIYTDGVTEAADLGNQEYGEERLEETLGRTADMSAGDVLSEVRGSVQAFTRGAPRSDDITAVVLKVLSE